MKLEPESERNNIEKGEENKPMKSGIVNAPPPLIFYTPTPANGCPSLIVNF